MSPDHATLLDRIETFDIDGPNSPALPFAARLARENGWSRAYAEQLIREYKRYVFLSAVSSEPVCPSEDVDAAWHLHLTYTRSYWKRWCGEVLGRPLHHDPTKGGPDEADKHLRMYARTLEAYREAFGHEAPTAIWPPAEVRFGDDLAHRMVNTARNWVIPKRPAIRLAQIAAVFLVMIAFVPGCNGGEFNPFNLEGADFLYFLIPMMLGAVLLGRLIRSPMRRPDPYPGDDTLELNWEKSAYLAGGYPRLTTAAIARLVESGAIRVEGDTLVRGHIDGKMTSVELAVLACTPITKSTLKPVVEAVEAAFAKRADKMIDDGFLVPKARKMGLGCACLLPLFAVIGFLAFTRLMMGLANNKPVGYLVATIVVGGILGVVLVMVGKTRLTRRGESQLVMQQARHRSLKTGGGGDVAMAVALFGTAVLVGSEIAYLQTWYPRQTNTSSGCGSGCGTSGGGCGVGGGGDGGGGDGGGGDGGGGGCGGCGGGGGD